MCIETPMEEIGPRVAGAYHSLGLVMQGPASAGQLCAGQELELSRSLSDGIAGGHLS